MIPYFKTLPELSRAFLLNGLRDQDLNVRMAASSGLINTGDVAAIPALEAAIAAETKPISHNTMEQGVKFLRKKQECGK
jgi:HEAT repeat protein